MADTEQIPEVDLAALAVVDPEIRKLAPDSDEYQAALVRIATEAGKPAEPDEPKSPVNEPDEDGVPVEDEPVAKKKGLDRRFSELTTERDQARQQAAAMEARILELERSQAKPEEFTPAPYGTAKPEVGSFETYADFQEALVDWKLAKTMHEGQQQAMIRDAMAHQERVVGEWNTREAKFRGTVEGYDQLVDQDFIQSFTAGPKPVASKEAIQLLFESDVGPQLLFDLAEDADELAKFGKMTAVRQVAYLARMEAKHAPTEESAPRVSKAPTPPKGLPKGNGAGTAKDFAASGGSFGDYLAWRERQPKSSGY